MKLNACALRHRSQPFDAIDLNVGFSVAADRNLLQQIRAAFHGVPLKEPLAVYAVGGADNGAWAAFQMAHHPSADLRVVFGELQFGYRPFDFIMPEHFVWQTWRYAHDDIVCWTLANAC